MKRLVCLAFCLLCSIAQAEEDTLDYFYTPQVGLDQQAVVNRVLIHARNTEYDNAISVSSRLLQTTRQLEAANPRAYGQLLVNHGIVLAASSQYEQALSVIDQGLTLMEQSLNPFSQELVNAIMAKGLTQMSMRLPKDAEDSFRRAQHITHRHDGVYTADQLTMLNYLTATSLQQGAPEEADRHQLLSLLVAEKTHGEASTAILPTLSRLGSYFASRGSTIPVMASTDIRIKRDQLFKLAISMYDRAIDIITTNYGESDKRMVPHLRGLASARLLQVTARKRAEEALLKSLAIIESQADVSIVDLAQAYIDLGDFYIILSDERSVEFYSIAWELLQESARTRELARELFGTPVRLYPQRPEVFYLDRYPDAAEGDPELYVELEYSVTREGRVTDIRVLAGNVPNDKVRLLRQLVRNLRYRPRMEDGHLVTTDNLRLHQKFRVIGDPPNYINDSNEQTSTVANDEVS